MFMSITMPLDASYLQYPKRRYGMDHDYYQWSNLFARAPYTLPDNKKVALLLVVPLEYFPLVATEKPFKAPGHMQTPYPDLRHYSARDYGTRIGFYRFLDSFAKHGVTASIALQASIAERYPQIVQDIKAAGHEIIAHGIDANSILYGGMDEADERKLIKDTLDRLERSCGVRPQGWMSVAQSQSFNTLRLLQEAGIMFNCDWVNDELPYRNAHGITLPVNHELSDRQIINVCQASADAWQQQIRDAYMWLSDEAQRFGGRMLPITLTPYILGLPYRMEAVEKTLHWLMAQNDIWNGTASQIVHGWSTQNP
jgi:allantoinase